MATKKRLTWHDHLAPFETMYYDMHDRLLRRVVSLSDNALRKLVKACRRVTQTNCSWAAYRVAREILCGALCELNKRQCKALRAKRKGEVA